MKSRSSANAPLLFLPLLLGLAACDGDPDIEPLAKGIFAELGKPLPSATSEQLDTFERGRKVAIRHVSVADGLGPSFNVDSCAACHERPVTGGSAARYRNFLLIGQHLEDGSFVPTGVNGIQDQYNLGDAVRVPNDPRTNNTATRNPIPFFGVGLLAEIEDAEISKRADPDDQDGDGISGRVNLDRGFVGRFGRKSQTVSIEGFIRGPLFNHLGLSSNPLSEAMKAKLPVPSATEPTPPGSSSASLRTLAIGQTHQAQAAAPAQPTTDNDGTPDPELSEQDLFDLMSFSMLLAAPEPEPLSEDGETGKALFSQIGCDACHVPTLKSPRGLLPVYSDLLIHDLGDALADGVVMLDAKGNEFRTQPLWGVGAVGPYLHDGRADTLDDAIRLHGGEAQHARDGYVGLSNAEQAQLIEFLRSLGGRSQASPGLLPPGAEVPVAGEYGGPTVTLDDSDLSRFARGRAVFDRDFGIEAGLGPEFNGDSCRACHFSPVIGGSGPIDVDVTRQGIVRNGVFETPPGGTIAHKLNVTLNTRPAIDPAATIFEHRQPPTLFGLGLIDQIPESTIQALEDPDDANGDGVSGRAHVLPDGRLGRLGWKANVPSLMEFARDAMSNEMGISVPPQPGLSFGVTTDDDAIADPEVSPKDLEDLVFFMDSLCPPPRQHHDEAAEQRGEQIFDQASCTSCHVPTLKTSSGVDVPLYSDLLLHDVAPVDYAGIEDGTARAREFRTPPLWGLSQSGPYMHDGHSATIELAISRHQAEAEAARAHYDGLSTTEKSDLLAFLQSL